MFDADPTGQLDSGLLRGPLLLAAHRDLFTGPRTALKKDPGPSPGKASTSKMNRTTHVAERHIAYTATLVCFALNSQDAWEADDGVFEGLRFYKNIMRLFHNETWGEPTLAWWDKWVYGTKNRSSPDTGPAQGSSLARLTAQRKERGDDNK
ncbi:hypothetical protein K474DRAFT_1659095 [Panus rudis PR-1116 ss-1]|nr:hypothetical protein K474DRAFT_1659095 [Panus rudis PR-1116 ss-1]